ncbi:unnamed protein product [Protopolystoma xenopodis]|uniref:Uncharacterized protein n=1 Tax=Protopolystoma xenopodis TaxID=117903 RepID=A0A448XDL5_9PLAT|nr:unnamed protein product [Protopolystoma xenopodis]
MARIGYEINWKATERKAPYGDNTRKRKISEAIDVLGHTDLMNWRLEECRVSDNFANCLSKLGEDKNRAWQSELRRSAQ